MSARARILARLRQAPVAAVAAPGEVNAVGAEALNGRPLTDLVQALKANLEAAHAEVREIDAEALPATLAEICGAKKIGTLLLPPGLELAAWADGPQLRRFDRPIEDHKDALFAEIDAGLTVADCAIADTGMLVVASSPTQPRTLSLVPPINICLVDRRRRLHANLPEALRAEGWAGRIPTNLIFISGPSKTADIQQTLAYGAHGPKELIVLIIDRGARS